MFYTHGHSPRSGNSITYGSWCAMRARCRSHKDYKGRGIKVCKRWINSFENFLTDMGERPSPKYSIERQDNDGDYKPSNCRWATRAEQARNRSNNHILKVGSKKHCVTDWAKNSGIKVTTLRNRVRRGWSPNEAVTRTTEIHRTTPVTYSGRSMMLTDWAKHLGVTYSSLHSRIYTLGWPLEKAFTQQYQDHGK